MYWTLSLRELKCTFAAHVSCPVWEAETTDVCKMETMMTWCNYVLQWEKANDSSQRFLWRQMVWRPWELKFICLLFEEMQLLWVVFRNNLKQVSECPDVELVSSDMMAVSSFTPLSIFCLVNTNVAKIDRTTAPRDITPQTSTCWPEVWDHLITNTIKPT